MAEYNVLFCFRLRFYVLFCVRLRFSTNQMVVLKRKRKQNKTYCSAIFNYVHFISTLRFISTKT